MSIEFFFSDHSSHEFWQVLHFMSFNNTNYRSVNYRTNNTVLKKGTDMILNNSTKSKNNLLTHSADVSDLIGSMFKTAGLEDRDSITYQDFQVRLYFCKVALT